MKNGMVIIDADRHAVDYEPVYRERLPAQYRNRATIYPSDNFDRTQNGKLAGKRPPSPTQNLADRSDIPGGLKRKIFFDNPQRFYGLTVDPASFGAAH
jgi:hypothetical protein